MSLAIALSIVFIVLIVILSIIMLYNRLKREQIKIKESRSNIDIYLQQRYEEISAMYKIVKEYKLHESETFKDLVKLRQLAINSNINFKQKTKIHNAIEQVLPKTLATFENYPELRSNENFIKLQEAIQDNEDNISSARKAYNGYVNRYNTSIAMFPANVFASIFGFKKEDLYDAPKTKMENPLL